jgi:biotin operon repressor
MKELTYEERKFFEFLAFKAKNRVVKASLRDLAKELGMSHPAILKKVKSLVSKGVVDYQKGHGRVPSRIIIKTSGDADEVTKTSTVGGYQNGDIEAVREVTESDGPSEVTKSHNVKVTKTADGYQKSDIRVTKTLDTGEMSKGGSGEVLHYEARSAVIRWLKMGGPPDAREIAAAADLPISAVEKALAEIQWLPERLDPAAGITRASAERDDVSAKSAQTTLGDASKHISDAESIKSEKTLPATSIQSSISHATTRDGIPEEAGATHAVTATSAQPSPPAARVEKEKVLESSHSKERLNTLIYHLRKLTKLRGEALMTELLHIYAMQQWGGKELSEDLAVLEREGVAERAGERRWRWRER